jgi:hypothetical protein
VQAFFWAKAECKRRNLAIIESYLYNADVEMLLVTHSRTILFYKSYDCSGTGNVALPVYPSVYHSVF